jgi:hypothetical protein
MLTGTHGRDRKAPGRHTKRLCDRRPLASAVACWCSKALARNFPVANPTSFDFRNRRAAPLAHRAATRDASACRRARNGTGQPACRKPSAAIRTPHGGSACPSPARGILPNCTCPRGETWNGNACIALPKGTEHRCPAGQTWNGSACGGPPRRTHVPPMVLPPTHTIGVLKPNIIGVPRPNIIGVPRGNFR